MSNPLEFNTIPKNIQMNAPRGRFTISSINSSRKSSVLSKSFPVIYTTCMEAQSGDCCGNH